MSQLPPLNPPPLNPLLPVEYPDERRTWPTAIGVISIVWASLGLICNSCSAIQHAVPGLLSGLAPGGPQAAPQAGSPVMLGLAIVGFFWSILLLVAGIRTLSRAPAGRALHLAWVAGAIPLGIIGTYFGYIIGKQQ